MASAEINDFLSGCSTPETGCFGSDPDALDAMLNYVGGDSGIRTDLQRVASASTTAAETGVPLDEATYEPVQIKVAGTKPFQSSTGPHGERRPAEFHRQGEPRKVVEDVDDYDEIGKLRQRIARCAHACGAAAVGCPLRTPPNPAEA